MRGQLMKIKTFGLAVGLLVLALPWSRAADGDEEPDQSTPWMQTLPSEDGNGEGLDAGDSFTPAGAGANADLVTADIQSLADGLAAGEGGPNNTAGAKRIFDYVHNRIAYT